MRIEMSEAECGMNSVSEFHQSPPVRFVAVTGLQEEQGEELDIGQGARGRGKRGICRGRVCRGRGRGSRSRG